MNRYSSRKFIMALLCLCSATALAWTGSIDSDAYQIVLVAIVGLYSGANVAQKLITKDD
jgi:hypothetical protein